MEPTKLRTINTMAYDNETDPMFPQLSSREIRAFRHAYCRWLRNDGVSLDVATKASFR